MIIEFFTAAVFTLTLVQVRPVEEEDDGFNCLQSHLTAQALFKYLVPTFHIDANKQDL